jgi:hypothetical protein
MLSVRQESIASLVAVLSLVVLSSDAAGQSEGPIPRWMLGQSTPSALVWPPLVDVQRRSLTTETLIGTAQPAQPGSSRDTLKNGAIIGVVAGAVALGTFGAFYCHLYQEEGGPSCLSDTLRAAAIGAAIGTGAGLAVDAALTRHGGVTIRIRIKLISGSNVRRPTLGLSRRRERLSSTASLCLAVGERDVCT